MPKRPTLKVTDGFHMAGKDGWVKTGLTKSGKCIVLLHFKEAPIPYLLVMGTDGSSAAAFRWTRNEDLAQKAFDHWLERGLVLDGLLGV